MNESGQDSFYLELLRAYVDSANDAIFVLCDEMKFLICNKRMEEWIGRSESSLTAHNARVPITRLVGAGGGKLFAEQFKQAMAGEVARFELQIHPEGAEERWVEIQLNLVDIDAGVMVIGVARDITERKLRQALLERQMTHDQLTDLPNWSYLREQLTRTLDADRVETLAVMIVGIDRFREINNTLGHSVGDQVLSQIARRLAGLVGGAGFVARQGGDEFAVLVQDVSQDEAKAWTRRIQRSLLEPVPLVLKGRGAGMQGASMDLDIGVSIGVALAPEHGTDGDTLLRQAGVALQQARGHAGDVAIYAAERDEYRADQLQLIGELRRAIEQEQFTVHYQPIVTMNDASVVGVEALVRWNHPGRGQIAPDVFIPFAESTGLVRALDAWVLGQAVQQLVLWQQQGWEPYVAVNVSPRTLEDPRFLATLAVALEQYAVEPGRLKLEITENVMSRDPEHNLTILQSIADLGVALALDDFGTGYSSLTHVNRFPISQLKIDRSFVKRMLGSDKDAAIVRSTIDLAHSLGLGVVAEGVEEAEVAARLKAWGCNYAQGWLYGRPSEADELAATTETNATG